MEDKRRDLPGMQDEPRERKKSNPGVSSGSDNPSGSGALRIPRSRSKTGKNRVAAAGLVITIVTLWLTTAIFAGVLAPFDPWEQHLEARFAPPGTVVPGTAGEIFILGTDSLGRDILSRLMHGARAALTVGLGALGISLVVGGVLGGLAGSAGGRVDDAVSLLSDSVLAIPTVLLAIALVSVLGSGQGQMVLSLGVVFTPVITRVVRSEVRLANEAGWMLASRVLGTPALRAFSSHIVPQVGPAVAIQASSLFSLAISLEASLSFLGIGSQPPQASWGLMLQEARNYLLTHGNLALAPGLCLATVVFALNLLGDLIAESYKR
ncbi:ABC transporter permease [Spirochaeta lutea]|uniref:ABC transporter permease n=1 Tax=Spirochaeta lutea TaxID=1480694 RepID=UPI00068B24CC|nr:ABC transporter permease [Spirochaeta lutea]